MDKKTLKKKFFLFQSRNSKLISGFSLAIMHELLLCSSIYLLQLDLDQHVSSLLLSVLGPHCLQNLSVQKSRIRPRGYKTFSCSTQLRLKLVLFINELR